MTTMLHTGDPAAGDADLDHQLALSQLQWVCSSEAGATRPGQNYAGLPLGF